MGLLRSGVRGPATIAVGPELGILFYPQEANSPRKSTGQGRGTDAQVAYQFSMLGNELQHTHPLGSPLTWHLRFCGSEVRSVAGSSARGPWAGIKCSWGRVPSEARSGSRQGSVPCGCRTEVSAV